MAGEVEQASTRPTVRVLRTRRFDPDLHADVSRVYGYRAECGCGWHGDADTLWRNARADLREHLHSEHNGNPTKGE